MSRNHPRWTRGNAVRAYRHAVRGAGMTLEAGTVLRSFPLGASRAYAVLREDGSTDHVLERDVREYLELTQ